MSVAVSVSAATCGARVPSRVNTSAPVAGAAAVVNDQFPPATADPPIVTVAAYCVDHARTVLGVKLIVRVCAL